MTYIVRHHVSKSFARATATLDTWPRYWDSRPYKRRITAVRKARAARKERAVFGFPPSYEYIDCGPYYAKVEILEVP